MSSDVFGYFLRGGSQASIPIRSPCREATAQQVYGRHTTGVDEMIQEAHQKSDFARKSKNLPLESMSCRISGTINLGSEDGAALEILQVARPRAVALLVISRLSERQARDWGLSNRG